MTEEQLDDLLADMVGGEQGKSLGSRTLRAWLAIISASRLRKWRVSAGTNKITEARQVAMFLSRELTTHSLKEVAGSFAKDHASVVYAVKATKEKCLKSESLKNSVELLRRRMSRGNQDAGRRREVNRSEIRGDLKADPDSGFRLELENSD